MTKFFYDLEFIEDGVTIDLISIGIVREDGTEHYAVNRDAPWKRIAKHKWLCENVVPLLPRLHGDARLHSGWRNPLALNFAHPLMKSCGQIANEVKEFLLSGDSNPELWADCGDYDHVCLMQLYGDMSTKPEGFPYYTCDLRQKIDAIPDLILPEQVGGVHNALEDARHNLEIGRALGLVR